jgi:hypothetical protein
MNARQGSECIVSIKLPGRMKQVWLKFCGLNPSNSERIGIMSDSGCAKIRLKTFETAVDRSEYACYPSKAPFGRRVRLDLEN